MRCILLQKLCGGWFFCGQIVVPILVFRNEAFHRIAACQLHLHALAGKMACLVVIQTEQNVIDLRQMLQQFPHRLDGSTAAGHIAVPLPILRVKGDVGKQIDGRLENIEAPIGSDVVKTAPWVAALHIQAKGFRLPYSEFLNKIF